MYIIYTHICYICFQQLNKISWLLVLQWLTSKIKENVISCDVYCEWVNCIHPIKKQQILLATLILFKGWFAMTVIMVFQDTSRFLWFIQSCKTSDSFALLSCDILWPSDFMSPYPTQSCSPMLLHSCFTGSSTFKR